MKKLSSILVVACALAVLISSCATPEERAARAAEQARKVTAALKERNYKISVNRMIPLRGNSKTVSYGYGVEVRNDSLLSYLPYFGHAYNVPYGGGKGLNFSAPIESYRESQPKDDRRHIEISLTNDEDTYQYIIDIFNNGSANIDVIPRERDRITYYGELDFK